MAELTLKEKDKLESSHTKYLTPESSSEESEEDKEEKGATQKPKATLPEDGEESGSPEVRRKKLNYVDLDLAATGESDKKMKKDKKKHKSSGWVPKAPQGKPHMPCPVVVFQCKY